MKQVWKDVGLAILLGLVLPGILVHLAAKYGTVQQIQQPESEMATETLQQVQKGREISVLNRDGEVIHMELEAYLVGVLLAEMPASFEKEALKAQAVVARTYVGRAEDNGKHAHAAVCMDSACCQGYRSEDDYILQGGTDAAVGKIREAVAETAGYVLTYEGKLIEATYFSCSGGRTEDALAVWGTDVPYLRTVSSPGEEDAAHYEDEQILSVSEVCEKLGLESAGEQRIFGKATYTAGGGVDTISACGKTFSGTEIRKLLGLRSTAFTVTEEEENVIFHTRGFGHRVGMSQYGADAMALEGSTFEQILAHYYPGTQLEKMSD